MEQVYKQLKMISSWEYLRLYVAMVVIYGYLERSFEMSFE